MGEWCSSFLIHRCLSWRGFPYSFFSKDDGLNQDGLAPAAHLINALIVILVISGDNSWRPFSLRNSPPATKIQSAETAINHELSGHLLNNPAACITLPAVGSGAGAPFPTIITLFSVCTFPVWRTVEFVRIRSTGRARASHPFPLRHCGIQ